MSNIMNDSKVVQRPCLRLVQVGVGGRDVDKPAPPCRFSLRQQAVDPAVTVFLS